MVRRAARWDTGAVNRIRLALLAACRTRHNPCDSHPRLCVRRKCACGAFPLVDLLPSADSAAKPYPPTLFARFVGTMRPSDSPQTCMSTLRPLAFFDRPTLPFSVGVCRVSRFSRMEFPHIPRASDSAVSKDSSRLTLPFILPSPYQDTVGTPKWLFRSSIPRLCVPLSTLRPHPYEPRRMTRGQNGALLLSCAALSSATPCRFNPGAFLDHLIRSRQHIRRNRKSDLLRGLKVDDEFKFRCLLHRQISRFGAFQNFIHVNSGAPKEVIEVRPVGHETALFDKLLLKVDRRQAVFSGELNDPLSFGEKGATDSRHNRVDLLFLCGLKGAV